MERRAPIAAAIRAGLSSRTPEGRVPFNIYYIPGFIAGPLSDWRRHLERIQKMGFRQICVAPVGAPGPSGDIFLPGDVDRADARLGDFETACSLIADLAGVAAEHGVTTLLDVVLDRVAADGDMARAHPELFSRPAGGSAVLDPRANLSDVNGAVARFDDTEAEGILARKWSDRLIAWKQHGAAGFRLLGLEHVPAHFVADLVATVRAQAGDCRFLGWTPGMSWDRIAALREADLDAVFASTPWWNGRASWYAEEHETLRRVAPIVAPVEVPFGSRLAQRTHAEPHLLLLYRQALQIAAATADGLLVPMGFELMSRRPLDARFPSPEEWQESSPSLKSDIASVNRLIDRPANDLRDEMRCLTGPGSRVTVLEMARRQTAVLINTDLSDSRPVPLPLDADDAAHVVLAPGEIRVVHQRHETPILESKRNRKSAVRLAAKTPRIVLENLTPRVDGGPFAAKRIVGQRIMVEADAYMDGHDVLAAELLWKAADSDEWQREPMSPIGNDRWQAAFTPFRVGRWLFTVEAWLDDYATLCRSIRLKREAGVDIAVELAEVRLALEAAIARKACTRTALADTLAILARGDLDASVQAMISPSTVRIVADSGAGAFAVQH
jgi:starch synthase (maltosyl-transferring)